ncbi:S-ribosylhomocysteine lyase [Prevotella sp. MGM1]|nr:S-ribosylhomocysteine lyase [Prevotella sp. MGM1]
MITGMPVTIYPYRNGDPYIDIKTTYQHNDSNEQDTEFYNRPRPAAARHIRITQGRGGRRDRDHV